jgi:hypothetical protein
MFTHLPIFCLPALTKVRFLSFGVGLDPRQAALFGPKLGPLLVGCILGIVSFASVGLAEGYPGLGANPARCFSYAVARGNFQCKPATVTRCVRLLSPFTNNIHRSVDLVDRTFEWSPREYCCLLYCAPISPTARQGTCRKYTTSGGTGKPAKGVMSI